jgi:hypothetical protein
VKQHTINPGSGTRAPGDIAVAALLAIGAIFERRRGQHAWLAAVPIIGVNTVAFYGQFSYFRTLAEIPRGMQVIMAASLESIAIYLAWKAHQAQLADDSALRLRLGAYLVALGIGALNYWHWCGPRWHPTPLAVVFALASAISPWLWSVHSRRESRDALKAAGKIDPHAVRLGATRWIWHMYRCVRVMWAATWIGETRPAEAIKLIQADPVLTASGAGDVLTEDIKSRQLDREPVHRRELPAPAKRRPVAVRPVRAANLKAVTEQELALALAGVPELPSVGALAGHEKLAGFGSESSRKRAARRVLAAVRAEHNGDGNHDSVDRP